ncbi:MAG: LacI family transcriptional regulator [candidate division KSB1 bacterium]|nr:LacI family transcriptional regulator [candidate division KSB1 bacterium]MDZ7276069.1 LacI family transcriptional regulator [candidate division KSB1 bacterium]MDZ7287151.1 LacI family transcriptional regulator [candidate division KSB1 bacterium]MDZ7296924.1 LacI family transcriptional regulator [candidate division KSB1 bacterium]MDZ7309619.1 LacI family transcriptional regulator [candidate division KSB1 bacterium]
MSVTIREVARKAGVSTATVSRVFNHAPAVDADTRRHVLAVARRLHYTPHAAGRSLSMKRTDAIGLLLPDVYGEFFSEVIRGADQAAQQNRYHLLVSSSHTTREALAGALQVMRGRVDGLIIMSPHIDAQTLKNNLPRTLPVVLLNCNVADVSFDSFNIDNFHGAYEMVRHLLGHGFQRIAIIKGTEHNLDAEERLRGYCQALGDGGAACAGELVVPGNFSEASGYEAARRLMTLSPRPDAIFASNDSMALGALSALREMGVRVPEDIALAGFDDIPLARYLSPALTSVHVPISELGAQAIHRLFQVLQKKSRYPRQRAIIPTRLVLRESCGCPRTARPVPAEEAGRAAAAPGVPSPSPAS